jgi:hypothetical protein
MEFWSWSPTILYVVIGIALFVISVAALVVIKALHPHERNNALLWSEAQRVGGIIFVVALIGGVLFITFRYS